MMGSAAGGGDVCRPGNWEFCEPDVYHAYPKVQDEFAWQRSAVDFLPQVVNRGTSPSGYAAAALQKLADAAASFDVWTRRQVLEGAVGKPNPPPLAAGLWWEDNAVPESHWWWRLSGEYDDDENFSDSDSNGL